MFEVFEKINDYENLFLRSKPVRMMIMLNNGEIQNATLLSKHVDCTYSHVVNVLEKFKKLDIVTFEKIGRIKIVKLTKKGSCIAKYFDNIRRSFRKP